MYFYVLAKMHALFHILEFLFMVYEVCVAATGVMHFSVHRLLLVHLFNLHNFFFPLLPHKFSHPKQKVLHNEVLFVLIYFNILVSPKVKLIINRKNKFCSILLQNIYSVSPSTGTYAHNSLFPLTNMHNIMYNLCDYTFWR